MAWLGDDSTIVTSRLVLHPLRVDDAGEMVVVLADPALHEFTGGEPASLDELRARFEAWVQGSGSASELWLNWIVRRRTDHAAVGTVQATIMDPVGQPEAMVAWTTGSPWQGNGYAGEAAAGLVHWLASNGAESVVAYVHADHAASGAVAARAGLRQTSEVVDGEVVWRRAEPTVAVVEHPATMHAFQPIVVGTMHLDHRLVVPSHSGGGGRLLDSDELFERHCAYWLERVKGGVQWVGGGPTFVRNPLIPGFEPTGVGSNGPGLFRHPKFVERMGEYFNRLHAAKGFGTVQFVLQGGMPIAPSPTLSGYADHRIPHALDTDEITWLIREYGESAALAAEAGADSIELHSNHDDVLQWFLSPLTNRRTDDYGGNFENRRRLVREIVETIRTKVGRPITLGLRLCLDEMIEGGYGIDDCQLLLSAFTADGTIDYFSLDVGGNWGTVSYIPPGVYGDAEWAELCGQAKQATHLPVVYVGRVFDVATAERVLAQGHADLVGFARATIADPEIVAKTRRGAIELIRPCVGVNDCIDRRTVEGLEFACAANPHAGKEHIGRLPPVKRSQRVLVIGGGPAGTEFAALAKLRGHRVTLWERNPELGGQLAVAARARMNTRFAEWIRWQQARLQRLGVTVELQHEATLDDIEVVDPNVVVVATGAVPRTIDVPGIDEPFVHQAAAVLRGGVALGSHVVVVSEDDRAAPLAVADHLSGLGHRVTVTYRTNGPSPLVGKYTVGAILARLDNEGARFEPMARLVGVEPGRVHLAHSYSNRRWSIDGVDSVVLACGAVPDNALYLSLKHVRSNVHLLGDAYAPRRMVFATRQAWHLASVLD